MTFDPSTYSSQQDMRDGKWHAPGSTSIAEQFKKAADLVYKYNQSHPLDTQTRHAIQRELLHPDSEVGEIRTPMVIEYGNNVKLGKNVFINYGLTILDTAMVEIGDGCMLGPNVEIITVTHPVDDYEMRAGGWEIAHKVTIGKNVWFGAGVTVLPGVTIGDNAVIGARSVVTKDIPANAIAVGSPARVVRMADPERAASERAQLEDGVPVDVFGFMEKNV